MAVQIVSSARTPQGKAWRLERERYMQSRVQAVTVAAVTTAWGWCKWVCFIHTETLLHVPAMLRAQLETQKKLLSSGKKKCVSTKGRG